MFRDLEDVQDAQEWQKSDPGRAEVLPNACVDFFEECHFSDLAKM